MPRPTARRLTLAAAVGLLGSAVAVGTAADAVILNDGFVIRGRAFKERAGINQYPFDCVDAGPKFIIYSAHTRKGGKVEKDVAAPELTAYKREYPRSQLYRAPQFGEMEAGDFDKNWLRTLTIRRPGGQFHEVKQLITFMDPNSVFVASTTHNWRVAYHTAEMDPGQIVTLLRNHPDLREEDGQPDPDKRMAIVTFLKDTGWLTAAREELKTAEKLVPPPWPKEQADRADALRRELDAAETRFVIDELQAAVGSGRYKRASAFLATYTPTSKDPELTTRLAEIRADVETITPKYEKTVGLLSELVDRVSGGPSVHAAVAGGPAVPTVPRPKLNEPLATLAAAGRVVADSVHPDTADRIALFRTIAEQERTRAEKGQKPSVTPDRLLAMAVSGWTKGAAMASEDPAAAARSWATRELALAYAREEIGNTRHKMLDEYLDSGDALPPDELAELISHLPPAFPADLSVPPGPDANVKDPNVRGIYKCVTGTSVDGADAGVPYFLRLPPEYHHGRSYPVLIALTHTTVTAEKMVAMLAPHADRNGYVVAALDWTNQFDDGYDPTGVDHPKVTAVLHDLLRRYQVDSDRAFLFGLGEGATFAFDMGASHPDLFAGVVAFGGLPMKEQYMHYWSNAQKLPYFVVTGEHGGGSAERMRGIYEHWMQGGFPALLTMYKGRGVEWYTVEVGRAFEWMAKKTRVRGTASLRLGEAKFEPWRILRPEDNRFYWVGTTALKPGYAMTAGTVRSGLVPAQLTADIRQGNNIIVGALGVRDVVVWLERNMIDWNFPVTVTVNGRTPYGFRPQKMTPDLHLMFEKLYRDHDRKMLYMGRLEFPVP